MSDITQNMIDRLSWKDGEYHYIVSLLASRGNVNVPRGTVLSYLDVQSRSANNDDDGPIAIAIFGARKILAKGKLSDDAFELAFTWMVEQRERIAVS